MGAVYPAIPRAPKVEAVWRMVGGRVPDYDPVLVLETSTVGSAALKAQKPAPAHAPFIAYADQKLGGTFEELPCGNQIEPLLYAIDLFVPALEMHQEGRCGITVEPAGFWWRIARALYAALGWVVTALTVLTASGLIRRHLED